MGIRWSLHTAAAFAAVVLVCLGVQQLARADRPTTIEITDATYWHTAFAVSDPNPDGLAVMVWWKDPDLNRQRERQLEDCLWKGLFYPYEPGRLSGHLTFRDPDQDDPCHDSPIPSSLLLRGEGLEAWIYRSSDLQQGIEDGWAMPETDEEGNCIWYVRNLQRGLLNRPRIAKGQVDLVWAGSEGSGPANHAQIRGRVEVERDPTTLAPLGSPVPGSFQASDTWSTSPHDALRFWYDVLVPIYYGVECDQTRPRPSDSGIMHAQSFGEHLRIELRLGRE